MDGYHFFCIRQLPAFALFLLLALCAGHANAAPFCDLLALDPHSTASVTSTNTDTAQKHADYVRINHALRLTDDGARRLALRNEIAALEFATPLDRIALLPHLKIALAHSELRLGNPHAAMNLLHEIPLDSPQAAAALILMGEAAHKTGALNNNDSMWMLHAAQLYPHQPETIEGLLRAASWQSTPTKALPFLLEAKSLADIQITSVNSLIQRMNAPDFIGTLALDTPDPVLWSLAHEALTDPAFSIAHQSQQQSLKLRACLQTHLQAHMTQREKNPRLIQDLGETLQRLDTLLPAAQDELLEIEATLMITARALKHCQQKSHDCHDLNQQRDRQGHNLTNIRNRLQFMEQQRRFLLREQKKLLARWQAEQKDMSALGLELLRTKTESRQIMTELLQKTLVTSQTRWQQLSARVHFQLATTQEALLGQRMKTSVTFP